MPRKGIQDVGAVGHDRAAVQADVPGEQVLRGEGAGAQVRHLQDGARGLQGGPGKDYDDGDSVMMTMKARCELYKTEVFDNVTPYLSSIKRSEGHL